MTGVLKNISIDKAYGNDNDSIKYKWKFIRELTVGEWVVDI